MPIPSTIVDRLPNLSGSETKAVIAIYSEGRPLTASDLTIITGMSKSTVYRCMQSESVKEANKHVTQTDSTGGVSKELRQLASRLDMEVK